MDNSVNNRFSFINSIPLRQRRWVILFTSSLLFFYNFIHINILNVLSVQIMHEMSIRATQLGFISSIYFYANFFMLLPAGLLLDRISTRKLIITAILFCTISMFIMAVPTNIYWFALSRFLAGIGGAFALLSCIKLASRWFLARQMAVAIGFITATGMLGGLVAQTPVAILSHMIGWRNTLLLFGVFGIAITAIIWAIVHDQPYEYQNNIATNKSHTSNSNICRSMRVVSRNITNWLAGIYTSLMNLPVFLLGALWGNIYLMRVNHITDKQASYVTSMMLLGIIVGAPLMGYVSDKLKQRKLLMVCGAIGSTITITIIIYAVHITLLQLIGCMFILGLLSSTQILGFTLAVESNSQENTGATMSLVSLLVVAGGYIFQPLFGWLVDLHSHISVVPGLVSYSASDLRFAILIMPIAFVVALMTALFIKKHN